MIFSTENATNLLRILEKNATKISALKLDKFHSAYEPQLFQALIRIIKSQEQLRQFSIVGKQYPAEFYGIISALESQKNSLQEVLIEYCNCNAEFEVLKNCNNLEILRMRYYGNPEKLNILNCKINTLEIVGFQIDASYIIQILENSGLLLKRLKFSSDWILEEPLLLEALKVFCPNITYLNISFIEFSTQLLEVIDNLQNLQFLTLGCTSYSSAKEELKMLARQFAEILPSTLQYLDLRGVWLKPYMKIFLNNCNAPLKKLLIYELDKKIAEVIIEFCIRNRTLKYVGLFEYLFLDDNIRNEMETYIKLVPYESIVIDC
ncbi:hypothetical protein F8M41_000746 [Gigaspora margarita]|uniref:Uncharacterized protein n=1 Tax=Gigaspora margarita TaxID=4874 RepID=A0A8H4AZC4_GIGMA|nr:hypothetical protein F8M41_000746 [Gigaspora margarita]